MSSSRPACSPMKAATRRTSAITSGPMPSPGRSSREGRLARVMRELSERLGRDRLVDGQLAIGDAEFGAGVAPDDEVRAIEVRAEAGPVAPGFSHHDQA